MSNVTVQEALKSEDVYIFDINQPFVTQEQKFKYWEESKAEIKRLKAAIVEIDKCGPVAWQFYQDGKWHNGMETNNHKKNTIDAGIPVRILYTSPQPRDWVGLSDTAWMNIVNHDHAYESMNKEDAVHYAVKATEAKLKQLNTKG